MKSAAPVSYADRTSRSNISFNDLTPPSTDPATLRVGTNSHFAYVYDRAGYTVFERTCQGRKSFLIAKAPRVGSYTASLRHYPPASVIQEFATQAEAIHRLDQWASHLTIELPDKASQLHFDFHSSDLTGRS